MAKNEVVQLRCTPIEKQRWNQAATHNGQELSPWIRHILNNAAGAPTPTPLFPDHAEDDEARWTHYQKENE